MVSTHRKNSYTAKMAELVKTRLQQRGQAASVLDLRLLPRDFMWKKIEGEEHPEFDYLIGEHIRDVHKFIFVIPEYNGSFPGM
ncbi:MAG TPA: NAD(P)H-dependent oxidoreductase, partial [Flavobacteriales bacterium]|nr:NAD(P)H-dependent oxidoreductase [Flavobacteriales bacterium]